MHICPLSCAWFSGARNARKCGTRTPRGKFISLSPGCETRWWTDLILPDSLLPKENIVVSLVTLNKAPAAVKKLSKHSLSWWRTSCDFRELRQDARGQGRHPRLGAHRPLPPAEANLWHDRPQRWGNPRCLEVNTHRRRPEVRDSTRVVRHLNAYCMYQFFVVKICSHVGAVYMSCRGTDSSAHQNQFAVLDRFVTSCPLKSNLMIHPSSSNEINYFAHPLSPSIMYPPQRHQLSCPSFHWSALSPIEKSTKYLILIQEYALHE